MTRILVTGATGFIGTHLVLELLRLGHNVACLVRSPARLDALDRRLAELAPSNKTKAAEIRPVIGDVCDAESIAPAIAGSDVVFHLAGLTKALRPRDFWPVNERGVENVAAVCARQSKPPVLVVTSSLAAAGPSRDNHLRSEEEEAAPVSHYGRSKRAGELAAERWADRAPISIVRPPIVFGEGDEMAVSLFRPIAKIGVHFVPGCAYDPRVSAIHAEDLVAALLLVAEHGRRICPDGKSSGYYFAAADEHPTYAELGRLIGTALGRSRVRVQPLPKRWVWTAAAAVETFARLRGKAGALSIDKVREARAGSWTCSPERIRSELGFRPAKPLLERLRQTAQWYRKAGWL